MVFANAFREQFAIFYESPNPGEREGGRCIPQRNSFSSVKRTGYRTIRYGTKIRRFFQRHFELKTPHGMDNVWSMDVVARVGSIFNIADE